MNHLHRETMPPPSLSANCQQEGKITVQGDLHPSARYGIIIPIPAITRGLILFSFNYSYQFQLSGRQPEDVDRLVFTGTAFGLIVLPFIRYNCQQIVSKPCHTFQITVLDPAMDGILEFMQPRILLLVMTGQDRLFQT